MLRWLTTPYPTPPDRNLTFWGPPSQLKLYHNKVRGPEFDPKYLGAQPLSRGMQIRFKNLLGFERLERAPWGRTKEIHRSMPVDHFALFRLRAIPIWQFSRYQ
jgi:hypothetical protein